MSLIHPTHLKVIVGSVIIATLSVGGYFIYNKVADKFNAVKETQETLDSKFPERTSKLSPSVHKILKGGQAINGAFVVLKADIQEGVAVDSIVPRYLKEFPAGWEIKDHYSSYAGASIEECTEINNKANIKSAPATEEDLMASPKMFGCMADNKTVFYKHASLD